MRHSISLFFLAALITQAYMAPQLISFKDGKLGVNFGGYHAGVGIGGILGGTGTAGGLYAEAGTPNGQSAKAGLGGSVDERGGTSGGLFAGATAGGNVRASAGLAGGVNAEKSAGGGYASAQAGDRFASSGLAGESSVQGSYESTVEVKPIHKDIKTSINIDSVNEVKPLDFVPLSKPGSEFQTKVEVKGDIQPPVVVKEVSRKWRPENYFYHKPVYPKFNFQHIMNSVFEVNPRSGYSQRPWTPQRKYNHRAYKVYVEQQPRVVEKHIIHTHYKPHRHHVYKTFFGGFVGNGGQVAPSPVQHTESAIQKRIDVGVESNANAGASVNVGGYGGVDQTYKKEVTYHQNPSFFEDIFNIPISTLKAVGNFLSNSAANTNVSVQKSASIQAAGTDSVPAKHDSSIDTSSNAQISSSSTLIDDIFAIPISTLGAVNKFLENNVAARKNVEVS